MKKLHYLLLCLGMLMMSVIDVDAQCDASFTAVVDCNCVTLTPAFTAPDCQYTWDFGLGGVTSNEENPTFCYSFTGNDTSSVNISLNTECPLTGTNCSSSMMIEVAQIPDAELNPSNAPGWLNCNSDLSNPEFPLFVENNSSTTLTNTIYIIEWGDSTEVMGVMVPNIDTFGANFSSTTHLFESFLAYNIVLTVIGENGCSATTNYEFINSAATPDIGMELDGNANECVGYTGSFIISNTEDNPPFTTYEFRVDDGLDVVIPPFNHPPPDTIDYTFTKGSCYDTTIVGTETYIHSFSVSITASIEGCESSTAAVAPIRIDEPPIAEFDIIPQTTLCTAKDTFHLNNESIPGSYYVSSLRDCSDSTWYYWSVSPNANYTLANGTLGLYNDIPPAATPGSVEGISLIFDAPGQYELSLVAQSVLGSVCDTSMVTKTICVLPQPMAAFTPDRFIDCAPSTINFTNTSNTLNSCAGATYNWSVDFIDSECGLDSSYQFVDNNPLAPSITFNSSGQYSVQLELINQCDTSYFEEVITIAQASVIQIDSIGDACSSIVIEPTFENIAECYAPAVCTWYFPNPSDPTVIDTFIGCNPPAINYTIVGDYTISVEVNNDCGNSSDSETFTIFDLPEIPEIIANTPLCVNEDLCLSLHNLAAHTIIEWTGPQGWTSTLPNDCILNVTTADEGAYQLSITDTLTSCTNDTTINIEIIELPNISFNPSMPMICIGDSVTITVSGADNYVWSPATGLNTTSGPIVIASPNSTTTYTVTSTAAATGCTSVDTIEVVVNPLPIVDAGPDTIGCTNSNLNLGGLPSGGTWTNAQGQLIVGGIVNESTEGEYTYYYTFRDNNFCSNVDSISVCIADQPDAAFTLSTAQTCINSVVSISNNSNTLNDCTAADYQWSVSLDQADCHTDSTGWTFASGNANSENPTFSFSLSGEYIIQLEVSNHCGTSRVRRRLIIGDQPSVQIDSFATLCAQLSVQPTAQIEVCNSIVQDYTWSFPGADITSFNGPFPPVITYPGLDMYTISLSVSSSCGVATDSYTFEIFDLPSVSSFNNGPLCAGSTLQLNTSSATAVMYQWAGPDSFTSDEANPTIASINLNQAGSYLVTVTDANGCTNTSSTEVIVLAAPNLSTTPIDASICWGDSLQISVEGADTYVWSPLTDLNFINDSVVVVSPTVTTNYVVLGTNTTTGCPNSDTIEVQVNPLPVVEAGENRFTCVNRDFPLAGFPAGGFWTNGMGQLIPNDIFNETVSGEYWLFYTFTDNNSCTNTDSMLICVANTPVANFNLDTPIACTGSDIQTINTSNTLNDCQSASYRWSVFFNGAHCHSDSSGWSFSSGDANSINPSFNFSRSGEYIIQLEVANDCDTARTSQLLTIGEIPQIQIDSFGLLCSTFTLQPTAQVQACNSLVQEYLWEFPGAIPSSFVGANSPLITYPAAGNYTITLRSTNACGSNSQSYNFDIFALPEVNTFNNGPLCAGDLLELGNTAPAAVACNWRGPNAFFSDQCEIVIPNPSTADAGLYILTVTDANGCTNEDSTLVDILPLPDDRITTTNSRICIGDTTQLIASSDSNYTRLWSPNLDISSTIGDRVNVFPTSNTSYILTSINATTGCRSHDTIDIIVNPLPTIQIVQNPEGCVATPLQLEAFPEGGTWTDSLDNIIINGSFTNPNPGLHTVYYAYTDQEGCSNNDSTTLCLQNNPLASFSIDTMSGCSPLQVSVRNTSNTLFDCGTRNYTWRVSLIDSACDSDSTGWSFTNGDANSIDASILFTLSGVYAISLEASNSCGNHVFSREVVVGEKPNLALIDFPNLCNEFEIDPALAMIEDCDDGLTSVEWRFEPDAFTPTAQGEDPAVIVFGGFGEKEIIVRASNGCGESRDTASFEIFELPTISAEDNGPLCVGDELILNANNSSGTVTWTGPNGPVLNPTISNIQVLDGGVYTATVSDPATGCSNIDSTTLLVNPLPIVDAGEDRSFCPADGATQLNATPAGGEWAGAGVSPDGNYDPIGLTPGTYEISYTYTDPSTTCPASDTLNFTVAPPALTELYQAVLCAEEIVIRNGTVYDIDQPTGIEFYQSVQTGCDSLVETIDLTFLVLEAEASTRSPQCNGEDNGAIVIENIRGGTPPYSVSLDGQYPQIVDNFPLTIKDDLLAGTYTIQIEDSNGCQLDLSDIIVIQPDALQLSLGEDQIINLGESVELEAVLLPTIFDPVISWDNTESFIGCDICTTPEVKPTQTTTYTATYTNEQGCSTSDEILIRVKVDADVYIPNIFSPNGDGQNDVFQIYTGPNVELIETFLIFDRWGEVIFKQEGFIPDDPAGDWDGTFKDEPMNPAVFVYYAKVLLVNGSSLEYKGDITLIR